MRERRALRFVVEALFLGALAAALVVADLDPLVIAGVMLLGWLVVALYEWAATRELPHYGRGLPPRYYVPQVALPPPRQLEQLRCRPARAIRRASVDDQATWIASPAMRAEALADWPVDPADVTTTAPSPGEDTMVVDNLLLVAGGEEFHEDTWIELDPIAEGRPSRRSPSRWRSRRGERAEEPRGRRRGRCRRSGRGGRSHRAGRRSPSRSRSPPPPDAGARAAGRRRRAAKCRSRSVEAPVEELAVAAVVAAEPVVDEATGARGGRRATGSAPPWRWRAVADRAPSRAASSTPSRTRSTLDGRCGGSRRRGSGRARRARGRGRHRGGRRGAARRGARAGAGARAAGAPHLRSARRRLAVAAPLAPARRPVRRGSRPAADAARAPGRVEARAVRRRLAQREFALAAVALLAAVIALAVAAKTRSNSNDLPAAYGSYPARAGSSGTAAFGKRTACGTIIRPKTAGRRASRPAVRRADLHHLQRQARAHAGDRPRARTAPTASST